MEINVPNATETDIAIAILKIAQTRPNGVVTFKRAYKEVPNYLNLSTHDTTQSQTRPNEQMWQQLVRNIKSHDDVEGNFINDGLLIHIPSVGYKITDTGNKYLSDKS